MIEVSKRRFIIEDMSELPVPRATKHFYCDVETTSFDDDVDAFQPYNGHRIYGWAFTWDDNEVAYYIPVRHRAPGSSNLDPSRVGAYMNEWVRQCDAWVNHNVKFDAHFAVQDGVQPPARFNDTLVAASMYDTDRLNHKLKSLCRDWLKLPMEEEDEIKSYLASCRDDSRKASKDYGRLPVFMSGKYACMDVLANRMLHKWLAERFPSEMQPLLDRERRLTRVLWDMEHQGLLIDREATMLRLRNSIHRMIELADEVHAKTGIELSQDSNSAHELLCGHLGLPVLARTKTGGASFDAEAMLLYVGHPEVVTSEHARYIVSAVSEYRKLAHMKGLFYEPFLEKVDDNGYLHGSYRQVVRTGRMAGYDPNFQQVNDEVAELIIAPPGHLFACWDGEQIEFRIIAHFMRNPFVLGAYEEDIATDFHSWVADVVQDVIAITRKMAKTVNFMTAFGAGKAKIMHKLAAEEDVMQAVYRDGMNAGQYEQACMTFAEAIYSTYHSLLPEIKQTAKRVENVAKTRGFVRNPFKRRRHLPFDRAHIAFNFIVQSTAADIVKDNMLRFEEEERDWMQSLGARLSANKHDELLNTVPEESIEDFQRGYKERVERCNIDLRVPITWSGGVGKTWKEAKGD